MELIKHLGYKYPKATSKYKIPYGLYICPTCNNEFTLTIDSRKLLSTECRRCSNVTKSINNNEKAKNSFINKCIEIHGDKYDYTYVDYINTDTKVEIVCSKHGTFTQTPHGHLKGQGCPLCAQELNDISKRKLVDTYITTYLYYIYLPDFDLWKVGCTTNTVHKRFLSSKIQIDILKVFTYNNQKEAYLVENYLLQHTIQYRYKGDQILKSGNTELRIQQIDNILELIAEAEASFATTT